MTDAVSYRVVNGVAWLTIERPEARNALNAAVRTGAPWAAPLSWLIPPRIALQILLTGDPISAQRGCQIGLVNEVVPLADLRSRAQQLAERIAANAPLSVLAAKRTAYLSRPDVFDEAERIWAPVYHSADAQEGPAAFRDKRPPVWTGR
jgi:enoyl-CoA hydratase/carnithine racemase